MSDTIKVQYEEVLQSISEMDLALQAMDEPFVKNIASGNVLELVNKLNQLNEVLEQQRNTYKSIFQMNNTSAKAAIQDLKETDERLSASINGSHGGVTIKGY